MKLKFFPVVILGDEAVERVFFVRINGVRIPIHAEGVGDLLGPDLLIGIRLAVLVDIVRVFGDEPERAPATRHHHFVGEIVGDFGVGKIFDVPDDAFFDLGGLNIRARSDRENLNRWPLLAEFVRNHQHDRTNPVDG